MSDFICMDIGGTSIKYGIIDESLRISSAESTPTPTGGQAAIFHTLEELVETCLEKSPAAKGICISSAGIIQSDEGFVLEANEELMPGYTGARLKERLSGKFHLPCSVENDVNCAALAEYHAGAAKGYQSSLTLTVGTGIGGAFILDGHLLKGHSYSALEVGYMHIGGPLSFEQQGATSVLVSKTEARLSLAPGTIDGRWIFDQASKGNPVCRETIAEMCDVLSLGISNLCYILNPEVVVIGGGISSQEAILRPLLEDGLSRHLIPPIRKQTSIAFAHLKNHAGMVGAYLASRA